MVVSPNSKKAKSIWRWLLLALIIAEVVLVRLRFMDIRTAIGVVVAIEALLLIVGFRQVAVAVHRYRRDRKASIDVWVAMENGMEVFLPGKLAKALASELKLWYCLGKWLLRRAHPGENDFTYHRKSILGPFLIVLLFTTPVELLLIELLLPWAWLRWFLLISAMYLFFWVCGLYASMVTLPYRLDRDGIRISYGILAQAEIAYNNILRVEMNSRKTHQRGDGLKVKTDEDAAYVAVGGKTNVSLHLKKPQALQGWLGPTSSVTNVHLAADEPSRLIQELERRVYPDS
ncbi:MAG: hypothetical protein HYX82_04945 [Chloroflexi bacterium]|nr:hypothetical protein [Chloroflexota bacterium]